MAKNIIFCADGTWNRPGLDSGASQASYPTNVFKTFTNLDGMDDVAHICEADEQERTVSDRSGAVLQIAKYLHGVGDSDNTLVKLLGGATGAGIIARIVRGYTFVSRNYVAGDKIFLIGFSRGAYTVRALAGLIGAKGLLDATKLPLADDKGQAYRLGSAVWYDYQQRLLATQKGADLLARLQHLAADLPAFLSRPPTVALVSPVEIDTVAVWDTVGALGIPEFTAAGTQADLFRFASTTLGPVVRNGLHAVSHDEQRGDFAPTLWDTPDQRITQLCFPGAHGDVGGGYPGTESGLSDCALVWMTRLLTGRGVRFAANPTFQPTPDPKCTPHTPWLDPPFNLLPRGPRVFQPVVADAPLATFLLSRMPPPSSAS